MGFYGSNVYIIPRFYGPKSEMLFELAKEQLSHLKDMKDAFIQDNAYNRFEADALDHMKFLSVYATLNFIFFKANNQEMKIRLDVLDVPPSRISRIVKVKNNVTKWMRDFYSMGRYSPSIKFEILYFIFQKNQPKLFFDYVEFIFKGKKISLKPFKTAGLEYVSSEKVNNKRNFQLQARQILAMGYFLNRLKNSSEGRDFQVGKTWDETISNYFESHPQFFKNPDQKFVFVLGLIHAKIANYQNQKGISTTIDMKLKGYKMRPSDFKNHFADLRWKLTQYSKEMDPKVYGPLKRLFEISGNYQVEAGYDWKSSIEDLNYAFLAGEVSTGILIRKNEELSKEILNEEEK